MTKLSTRLIVTCGLMLLALGWMMVAGAGSVAAQQAPGQLSSVPVTLVSPIPVPVTGLVKEAGTPFTTTTPKTSQMGEPPAVVFPTQVSAGQLILIQHVSVKLSNCPTGTLTVEDFRLRAGAKDVFLAPVHLVTAFANTYIANESLRFLVEPGETISIETENFGTSGCGPASMIATISGVEIAFP